MPDELLAAIEDGDADRAVALLTPLSEIERRGCAAAVAAVHARAHRDLQASFGSGLTADRDDAVRARHRAALLGLFGTATRSAAAACRFEFGDERIGDVLLARRPPWTQDWCESVVTQRWPLVRRLMAAGLYERTDSEAYTLGLIAQCGKGKVPIRALLERAPDVLEIDVWKLFVHEGHGETSLAAVDKYMPGERSWATALAALAEQGRISRARLLDATLDALERDFATMRAGWFSRFHERLAPTPDEREERVARYVRLLASRVAPTVAFALRALEAIAKAARPLPADLTVLLEPAYRAAAKGTALDALALGVKTLATAPDRCAAARAFAAALEHPAADVQRAALAALEASYDGRDLETADRLTAAAGAIAPSLRGRFVTLCSRAEHARADAVGSAPGPVVSPGLDILFPPAPASADAPATALANAGSGSMAVHVTANGAPSLVPPIESVRDLVEASTAAIESDVNAEDLERVLDGLSRLCAERPAQFDRLVGPLRKRAAALSDAAYSGNASTIRRTVAALVHAWLTQERRPLPRVAEGKLLPFLVGRLRELAMRLERGIPYRILAAPTHVGSFIEPEVFARRLAGRAEPVERFDLIAGLLRMHHAGRGEALRVARVVPGEIGDAVRYALGGDDVDIGSDAALWVAASRARDPLSDDPMVERAFGLLGPDTTRAATLAFAFEETTHTVPNAWRDPAAGSTTYRSFHPNVIIGPELVDDPRDDVPTAELYRSGIVRFGNRTTAQTIRWLAGVWPANNEGVFVRGVRAVGDNLDWWEAQWENRAYFEPLVLGGARFGPAACLLVSLGLLAKDAAEGAAAVDAIVAGLLDGRLSPLETKGILRNIVAWHHATKTKRALPRLERIARVSSSHGRAIADALGAALDGAEFANVPALRPLRAFVTELRIEIGDLAVR